MIILSKQNYYLNIQQFQFCLKNWVLVKFHVDHLQKTKSVAKQWDLTQKFKAIFIVMSYGGNACSAWRTFYIFIYFYINQFNFYNVNLYKLIAISVFLPIWENTFKIWDYIVFIDVFLRLHDYANKTKKIHQ